MERELKFFRVKKRALIFTVRLQPFFLLLKYMKKPRIDVNAKASMYRFPEREISGIGIPLRSITKFRNASCPGETLTSADIA